MEKFCFIVVFFIAILSCQSHKERRMNANKDNKEVSTQKDIEIETIPNGFSINSFKEMTPNDAIEMVFLSDLKKILESNLKCDYQSITDKYYPDYFILLQKECPNFSIDELKEKFKNNLHKFIPQRNQKLLPDWCYAKHYDMCITSIKNKVHDGNGCLLFLYEFHTLLSSDNITIAKDEPGYAVAVSLDNGVNWYSVTSPNINEVKSLLRIRFPEDIIESLLRK